MGKFVSFSNGLSKRTVRFLGGVDWCCGFGDGREDAKRDAA